MGADIRAEGRRLMCCVSFDTVLEQWEGNYELCRQPKVYVGCGYVGEVLGAYVGIFLALECQMLARL